MKNGFPYAALRRFDNETHRIDGVMNPGLFNKRYLAAGQYTIADMICYPWASQTHSWRDTDSNLRQASFNFDPPRFGAKRLEQQRDWRIWEKISRVQSGPFFFLKTLFAQ